MENFPPSKEELKELLSQNLAISKEIQATVKKIHRYVFFKQITGIVYLLLILTPIILGIIYLPNLLKNNINNLIPGLCEGGLENFLK